MNQEIEVRPGVVIKSEDGKAGCRPILSKIVSLYAEHNDLQYAVPGGLIGLIFLLLGLRICYQYHQELFHITDLWSF